MVNIAQQQVLCIFFFCACIIGIKLFKLHKLQKGVNSLDQLICVGKTKMYKLRISRLDLTLTTRSSLVSGYPPFCSESPQGTNTSITFLVISLNTRTGVLIGKLESQNYV